MLIITIRILFLSILFIFLVHHLICFFKNALTIPKTKDLVTSSSKKYEDILSVITKTPKHVDQNASYTSIDLLPMSEVEKDTTASMKDELKNFIKKQWQEPDITSEYDDISGFTPFSNL